MICKHCGYDEGLNAVTGKCPSCNTKVTKAKPEKKEKEK